MKLRLIQALYNSEGLFDEVFQGGMALSGVDKWTPEHGDVLLLHGGADISPTLYNSQPSARGCKMVDPSQRDLKEVSFVNRAIQNNVPIIGICRGAQLLCAMNGGQLFQHVESHDGTDHIIHTTSSDKKVIANSIHHQMMRLKGVTHQLLAWTIKRSNVHEVGPDDDKVEEWEVRLEPEVVWFPQVKGLGIQGHPEMVSKATSFYKYCLNTIEEYVCKEFKA